MTDYDGNDYVRELRAQVERLRSAWESSESERLHAQCRLSETRTLLEDLDDLLEQTMTNTPHPPSYSDWKKGSANILTWLKANPESPRAAIGRSTYEVWVGTEKTKERIVLETADIEEAARVACADLSGCTFWGIKTESPRAAAERACPWCNLMCCFRLVCKAELARRAVNP